MAKTVDKELMRENIIQAAINAFLKNGVNNSTMELIAKEANIAKGTLYLYFNSKQELISACNVAHYTERKALLMLPKIFDSLDVRNEDLKIPTDFVVSYITSIFIGTVNWWIEQKNHEMSANEFASLVIKLISNGHLTVLGVNINRD